MRQSDYTDWDAVRIGQDIVGWLGPIRQDRKVNTFSADVMLVMGEQSFRLDVREFQWGYVDSHPDFASDKAVGIVLDMLGYSKRFAVPVPLRSLDVLSDGELSYSVRTVNTVMSALHKFFTALEQEIQAQLHSLSPVEVVRKIAELSSCNYPERFLAQLRWRDASLNERLGGSSIIFRMTESIVGFSDPAKQVVSRSKSYLYRSNKTARSLLLLATKTAENKHSSSNFAPFISFVDWQVRSRYNFRREAPSNVIHIKASSKEEYKLGKVLFSDSLPVHQYMLVTMPGESDASFFLSMAGDPLEDWIDGKVITVAEFQSVTSLIKGSETLTK